MNYNTSLPHASLGFIPPEEYNKIQIPFEKLKSKTEIYTLE
jgi:hypothetical protein